MVNWKILGTICGICAAPFTGGASLGVCLACTGLGYAGGTVAEQLFGNDNRQGSQAPSEAFNLLNKSIEEMAKMRKDLEEARQKELEEKKKLEKNLEEVRDKLKNPQLREPHETDESLKDQELFFIAELRKINHRIDEKENQINTITNQQTNTITAGTSQATNTISGSNFNNFAKGLQPSFTTKIIIAAVLIIFLYLMFIKG